MKNFKAPKGGKTCGFVKLERNTIHVPEQYYNVLKIKWLEQIKGIEGLRGDGILNHDFFLGVYNYNCSILMDVLDPISFNISDTKFEISPRGYLQEEIFAEKDPGDLLGTPLNLR